MENENKNENHFQIVNFQSHIERACPKKKKKTKSVPNHTKVLQSYYKVMQWKLL